MAKRPTDYINLSELSLLVAKNWREKFPTYRVNFIEQTLFETEAGNFKAKAFLNSQQDILKKTNTSELKITNKAIDEAVKTIRKYIAAEYPNEKDLSEKYAMYGLERIGKNGYRFPVDNDRRMQRMQILVAKISEANDPMANKPQGRSFWLELSNKHSTLWADSKKMNSDKTTLSRETKAYYTQMKGILDKLYAQLKLDFPKEELAQIRREFGFLNEYYK